MNPDAVALGGRGPYEYLIAPLNEAETDTIRKSGQALLKRLQDDKAYFKVEDNRIGYHR